MHIPELFYRDENPHQMEEVNCMMTTSREPPHKLEPED